MKTYVFFLFIVFTVMPEPAATQEQRYDEPEYVLDEITVTAARVERKSSEIPASVTIVDNETINNSKMLNIKDALIGTPGVLIDTKNQGYDSRLIIRGAGLKARYGVRDIMVLLDGIPITDPDSLTRLDFIDTQLIDQVEVVKGPNSTLWGANAAGGVINFITKDPMEREGGSLKIGAGNHGTYNGHLSYSSDLNGSLYYTISGSHRQSDNSWRRWNEFSTSQGTFQGVYLFDNDSSLETHLSYTKASLQLPGKLDETMFNSYLDSGEAPETEGPWQFSGRYSEILFFSARYEKQVGVFEYKPVFYINHWTHHHPVTARINDADTNTYGADLQVNHTHHMGETQGTLTAGITARRDDQDTDYYKYRELTTSPGSRITAVRADDQGSLMEMQGRKVNLYGIYVQESFRPGKKWIIDTGVRYDYVNLDISGTQWSSYDWAQGNYTDADPAPDHYKTTKIFEDICPRIGAVYKATERFNIYTGISKGIKTPTEGEINENPDLEIVEILNYEFGVKARDQKWSMDTAFYFAPIKDEVVQVVQENNDSEYVNAGATEKKGFELAVSLNLSPRWTIGFGYSYTDYTFKDFTEPVRNGPDIENTNRSGNSLPLIPEHQYSILAGYKKPLGMKFSLKAHTWGEYYLDNANTEKYKGYAMVTSAMAGYETDMFDISLIVDNLFDDRYASEVNKDTSGVKRYTPAAPRSFMVKCVYKF